MEVDGLLDRYGDVLSDLAGRTPGSIYDGNILLVIYLPILPTNNLTRKPAVVRHSSARHTALLFVMQTLPTGIL